MILKNLNKTEEEKITLLEKENTQNYLISRNIRNIDNAEKKEFDKISNLDNENNITMPNAKIVNYYPNSKNEIIDLLYEKIDHWFFLGNLFFICCTLSIIIIYTKTFDLQGDIFPTVISIISLSKIKSITF